MSYLTELNDICNRFLDFFGNPFSVEITRDFEVIVTRPDGYTCRGRRESGGRKCVLSIVMRFAINQLFAKRVGLIALDEPTAYLDEDNLEFVAGLIENIPRIFQEMGTQIIVITHERTLVSAFDHVIDVKAT